MLLRIMPDQHVFPFCTLCFYVCHVFVFMLSLTYFEKYVQQPEFVVSCLSFVLCMSLFLFVLYYLRDVSCKICKWKIKILFTIFK